MKKITLLAFTLISTLSFGQADDLFFSMYAEGSSNNKWLEIYNGTGEDVDLTGYTVKLYSNGSAEPNEANTYTFEDGATLADGDVFVIANDGAEEGILAEADATSNVTFYNGDDAIALFNGDTMLDVIGEIGNDPGSFWAVGATSDGTKEHTLIRKSTVCGGNPNNLGSFGTNDDDSEWMVYGQDEQIEAIGSHTGCDTASNANFSQNSFVIYPNPSVDGNVSIQTKSGEKVNVTVFDILGKKVVSKNNATNINVSGLKTGIYLVQVSQNGATVTKKLVVQ